MLRNPAGERNKQPILEALQHYIDVNKDSRLLEISSGNKLIDSKKYFIVIMFFRMRTSYFIFIFIFSNDKFPAIRI